MPVEDQANRIVTTEDARAFIHQQFALLPQEGWLRTMRDDYLNRVGDEPLLRIMLEVFAFVSGNGHMVDEEPYFNLR